MKIDSDSDLQSEITQLKREDNLIDQKLEFYSLNRILSIKLIADGVKSLCAARNC